MVFRCISDNDSGKRVVCYRTFQVAFHDFAISHQITIMIKSILFCCKAIARIYRLARPRYNDKCYNHFAFRYDERNIMIARMDTPLHVHYNIYCKRMTKHNVYMYNYSGSSRHTMHFMMIYRYLT